MVINNIETPNESDKYAEVIEKAIDEIEKALDNNLFILFIERIHDHLEQKLEDYEDFFNQIETQENVEEQVITINNNRKTVLFAEL